MELPNIPKTEGYFCHMFFQLCIPSTQCCKAGVENASLLTVLWFDVKQGLRVVPQSTAQLFCPHISFAVALALGSHAKDLDRVSVRSCYCHTQLPQ